MSFNELWESMFAEACNEAQLLFKGTDKMYNREVKRRAGLSPMIGKVVEHEGDIHLTDEQRKTIAEYLAPQTGEYSNRKKTAPLCYHQSSYGSSSFYIFWYNASRKSELKSQFLSRLKK